MKTVMWVPHFRSCARTAGTDGDRRLRAGECLGVGCPAFHAAQPCQAKEDLVIPPVTVPLRRKALMQQLHLASGCLRDRKSTRLNSSHVRISYAVFCLKKKKKQKSKSRLKKQKRQKKKKKH